MYCIEEYAKEGIEYFKQLVEIKVIDEDKLDYSYLWISKEYVYDEEYMKELAEAHFGLSLVLHILFYLKVSRFYMVSIFLICDWLEIFLY